ncbi:MAG TPA: hypothetical protein ENH25_07990 [candidate division Zixibacteria bacterium]|nr:hypothetical protein [candidate division Zixibacteria bacterium]
MSTTTLEILNLLSVGRITVNDAISMMRSSGKVITDMNMFNGIGIIPPPHRIGSIIVHENNVDFLNPF